MKRSMNVPVRNLITILAATLMLAACGISQAEVLTFNVSPDDLASPDVFLNGLGTATFGYDADMPKPEGSNVSGPTGDSCFYSDVQGSKAGGTRAYTSIRISLSNLFGVSDVTVSDLSSISYYTKLVSGVDWQIKIYTEKDATSTSTSWYQTRIEFNRPTLADDDWNQYTADGLGIGKLTVTGTNTSIPGTGLLSDLDAKYGSEKVLFVEFIASFASSSPASYSYLDGLSIALDNGSVATVNLVPEPSSIILMVVGLAFYALKRR
jgi:hypothetical protein